MYYPSSQIETNLYTNGQEYIIKSTQTQYTGYYWKTASGKVYTGKTPQDKNIQELILLTQTTTQEYTNLTSEAFEVTSSLYLTSSNTIAEEYNKLNNKLAEPSKIPISFNPQPTQEDYTTGNFTRYFCKKYNENVYIEVNSNTYAASIQSNLYFGIQFLWVISGDKEQVKLTNAKQVDLVEKTLNIKGLAEYLRFNYLQFYQA